MSVKLIDLKEGDRVVCDDAFTCATPGFPYAVRIDEKTGTKFINCRDGRHYLDGQLRADGTLAGVCRAEASATP